MEGLEIMIDREHDSIDYSRLSVYGGIFAGTVWFWYSIFTNGFFVSVMWLVVVSAVFGLWLRLSGRA